MKSLGGGKVGIRILSHDLDLRQLVAEPATVHFSTGSWFKLLNLQKRAKLGAM